MPIVDVNHLAVLVCGLISMALGMTWYAPKVFGNVWMKEIGASMADIEKAKGKGMGASYALAFAGALLTAYVLSHFVDYAGATTAGAGIRAGLWAWLGFVVPVQLGSVLWDGKSWKYFAIVAGYYLVQLVVFGAVLATWA